MFLKILSVSLANYLQIVPFAECGKLITDTEWVCIPRGVLFPLFSIVQHNCVPFDATWSPLLNDARQSHKRIEEGMDLGKFHALSFNFHNQIACSSWRLNSTYSGRARAFFSNTFRSASTIKLDHLITRQLIFYCCLVIQPVWSFWGERKEERKEGDYRGGV